MVRQVQRFAKGDLSYHQGDTGEPRRFPRPARGKPEEADEPAREQSRTQCQVPQPTQYRPATRHSRPETNNTAPKDHPNGQYRGLADSSRGEAAAADECRNTPSGGGGP
jgi:hypothetical protein